MYNQWMIPRTNCPAFVRSDVNVTGFPLLSDHDVPVSECLQYVSAESVLSNDNTSYSEV